MYPNHILVSPSVTQNNSFDITTQKFTGKNDRFNPLTIDTFYLNGTFRKNSYLYYDKLNNMNGRVVNISAITYLPYSITETVVNIYCAILNSSLWYKI